MMQDIYARQRPLLGDGQKRLAESKVVVVGAGGTGSPTVLQLAHAGVGRIHVVDHDVVVESNLNRVYGATPKDVEDEVAKVEVVRRLVGHLPGLDLHVHPVEVPDAGIESIMAEADLVIGCVDNHHARDWLNDFALHTGKPLIDVGCKALQRIDGSIHQLTADVRSVRSGTPCLYCYGAVTPEGLAWEALSPAEQAARVADGYAQQPGAEHAIVMMTTLGACVVASQAVALMTGQETHWKDHVILDAWGMPHLAPTPKQDCGVCGFSPTPHSAEGHDGRLLNRGAVGGKHGGW